MEYKSKLAHIDEDYSTAKNLDELPSSRDFIFLSYILVMDYEKIIPTGIASLFFKSLDHFAENYNYTELDENITDDTSIDNLTCLSYEDKIEQVSRGYKLINEMTNKTGEQDWKRTYCSKPEIIQNYCVSISNNNFFCDSLMLLKDKIKGLIPENALLLAFNAGIDRFIVQFLKIRMLQVGVNCDYLNILLQSHKMSLLKKYPCMIHQQLLDMRKRND